MAWDATSPDGSNPRCFMMVMSMVMSMVTSMVTSINWGGTGSVHPFHFTSFHPDRYWFDRLLIVHKIKKRLFSVERSLTFRGQISSIELGHLFMVVPSWLLSQSPYWPLAREPMLLSERGTPNVINHKHVGCILRLARMLRQWWFIHKSPFGSRQAYGAYG